MRRLLCVLLFARIASADTWTGPSEYSARSANGVWRVTISPRYEGSVAILKKGWRRVARWRPVNRVEPVSALVANDGTVVTFDNWGGVGQGDDVVVLYRAGKLVRKFGLDAFLTAEEIAALPHSVSSIQWSGRHRVDEEKRQLILQVVYDGKSYELPVDLETGELLGSVRLPIPKPFVDIVTVQGVDANDCVTTQQLTEHALTPMTPPAYPSVARKVRIAGKVIVRLAIDADGNVSEVRMVKPLPFGLDQAAAAAAKQWRFRPFPQPVCAVVAFDFGLRPE
ncbi:MAG TPA: energy transducer TonB [Thermoanaerobaculia bacterium]|nr:energy transducer TonB [Thermoanaerobaculia bacterium]